MALGPPGAASHDTAAEAFATRLRAVRDPDAAPSGSQAEWVLVAGRGGDRQARDGRAAATLPALEDELVAICS
jgi:hypothetical protein